MVANFKEKPRPAADFFTDVNRIARTEGGARLVAKVLREILCVQTFQTSIDLKDALQARCRELGLVAAPASIDRACDLVSSNTALFAAPPSIEPAATPPATPPVSHVDAKQTLTSLGIDVHGGRFQKATTRRSRLVAY